MSDTKKRYPLAQAKEIAAELEFLLAPHCERIIIAGSIRRRRADVADIELLYIPRYEERQIDLLSTGQVNTTDGIIDNILSKGILAKRLSKNGSPAWGAKNKLAVHVNSGIPVDLFATDAECWHNYLVCRTGPAESNMRIATAAQKKGLTWHPYGTGFTDAMSNAYHVASEMDVFHKVGLPYLSPEIRS